VAEVDSVEVAYLGDEGPRNPIRFELLHAVRGRVRMRSEDRAVLDDWSDSLEAFLRDRAGVEQVSFNPTCRTVVVTFDAEVVSADDIAARVERVTIEDLRSYRPRRPTPPPEESTDISWLNLGLSSAAVALGVFAESTIAPWFLAGAAVPIFKRAFDAIAGKGKLNVDVLDAAATTVLAVQGQFQTAAVMVWLVSLGDFIRDLTLHRSHRAIEDLFDGKGSLAWVVRDGRKTQIPVEEVQPGDEVVVYPGELVPVDGTVTSGKAMLDQKLLTGESMPVEKGPGDSVFAATAVREGKLYLEVAKVGNETMVAKVIQLVRDAPLRETRVQNYAERFADQLVPWSLLGAGASFVATGTVDRAAALLIIDYGTGIRVAAPTAVLASLTRAARMGILVKGGRYLEQLAEVDAIVFDKTGTLTVGEPEVTEIVPLSKKFTAERILALAASAEDRLTHPISEAIVRAAKVRELTIPERDSSEYTIGLGVEASVDGMVVTVGCDRFMASKDVATTRAGRDLRRIAEAASTPIFVAIDGTLVGLLVCNDPLRPEAAEVVAALRARGVVEVVMLTGDQPAVAQRVAESVGITRYIADALPQEKSEVVRSLQRQGRRVAVIGDGINDSPALAQADVGIAVRGGADVARETAHVALLQGNLWNIPRVIDLARDSMRLIQQSWTVNVYGNTTAVALSVFGVFGPIGATLVSNGSAILGTLNGLRPLLAAPPSDQRNEQLLQHELHGGASDGVEDVDVEPARHPTAAPGRGSRSHPGQAAPRAKQVDDLRVGDAPRIVQDEDVTRHRVGRRFVDGRETA
jgi:Cu2+-exporting ATPase